MKTTLLRHTRHARPGVRTFEIAGVTFDLRAIRCHVGHRFEVVWFPCWLLNCCWSHWSRNLQTLADELCQHPHEHYLPRNTPRASAWRVLRDITVAHQ